MGQSALPFPFYVRSDLSFILETIITLPLTHTPQTPPPLTGMTALAALPAYHTSTCYNMTGRSAFSPSGSLDLTGDVNDTSSVVESSTPSATHPDRRRQLNEAAFRLPLLWITRSMHRAQEPMHALVQHQSALRAQQPKQKMRAARLFIIRRAP